MRDILSLVEVELQSACLGMRSTAAAGTDGRQERRREDLCSWVGRDASACVQCCANAELPACRGIYSFSCVNFLAGHLSVERR